MAAAVVVTGLALTAVVAAPAGGAWTTTVPVSASGWTGQDSPTVAVDRQGDALLVWAACDAAASGCYHQVQARRRTAAGALGPILTLSPLGSSSAWPQVASDDDGDSVVVWEQDGRVVGRRVSSTGALGTLRTLSSTSAGNPAVVIDPLGRALAVWSEVDAGFRTKGRFIYRDGTVGSELSLGSGAADQPSVGIDRTGTAVVAWTEGIYRVVARRVKPGSISATKVFTSSYAGVSYGRVSVGVDRDGDAIVSFLRHKEGERSYLWARRWTRTGSLGGVLGLAPSTDNLTFYHALGTDLEGDSMVIWSRRTSQTRTDVFGRRIYRTGALGAITALGVGDRPAVALDDDGNGMAVWHSPGPPYDANVVYARTISTTGVFSGGVRLSLDGRVPRVDSSPGGRFSVIWQQKSYPYRINARIGP
ncbi:MAG TPA: hypothetical protein VFB74_07060 [Kribbellaceae bacterium]|nr:hypothetical protein [Kribbellaceae bacterium]